MKRHCTAALVCGLLAAAPASPEFTAWWDAYELEPTPAGPLVLADPQAGHLLLEHVHLLLSTPSALTLAVLLPGDEATRRRIRCRVRAGVRSRDTSTV